MARKPATPDTTQAEPTQPRPIGEDGRALDAHGLPLGGPARIRALAELGKPDPRDDPAAWGEPAGDPDTTAGDAGQQD